MNHFEYVQLSLVVIYLVLFVCFSLGVFNQLYSKTYPAYSSSP